MNDILATLAGAGVLVAAATACARRGASVASITKTFVRTAAKLERHEARKLAEVVRRQASIDTHTARATAAVKEATLARNVRGNIGTLLGDVK